MALELVGRAGAKDATEPPGMTVALAEAERLVAGARQRLGSLADALAVLRRGLMEAEGHRHGRADTRSPSLAGGPLGSGGTEGP